jgi:hypothetical protein
LNILASPDARTCASQTGAVEGHDSLWVGVGNVFLEAALLGNQQRSDQLPIGQDLPKFAHQSFLSLAKKGDDDDDVYLLALKL